MGGTSKNVRRRKAIKKALDKMPDKFTTHDITHETGISPTRASNLLRGLEEVKKIWEV